MRHHDLTPDQRGSISHAALEAIAALPPRRKVARIEWEGRSYAAVRTFRGAQVQTLDRKRLIANINGNF